MGKTYKKHEYEQILEKGVSLLWGSSYFSLKVDAIIDGLGISKGVFYHYFNNKEDFARKSLRKYVDDFQAKIYLYTGNDSIQMPCRLKDYYADCIVSMMKKSDTQVGCLMYNMIQESNSFDDDFRSFLEVEYDKLLKPIVEYVNECKEFGLLSIDMEPIETAYFIHNTFAGSLLQSKLTQSVIPVEIFVDILFNQLKIII